MRWVLFAVLGSLHLSPAGWESVDDEKVLFGESFAAKLGEGWSWVREDPKAWKVEKDALVLRSMPGYLHANHNDSRNLLLRKPPETNKGWIVEVFLENQPVLQYEHAGLLWYYDDDHYVSVWRENTGQQEIQMVHEKEAKPRFAHAKYEGQSVWLRLVIGGGTATSYYRVTEKDVWSKVGEFDLPVKGEPKVGLGSGGGPKDIERFVRFSRFRILENPN